ncbi:MAG: cyclase family protein [Bacillota bacterium]|nr:cyclase family protein [Bacillota bacterium]
MKMIDLTHMITEDMPLYPGMLAPQLKPQPLGGGYPCREKTLLLMSHTGTHCDAPAHMLADGATLDQLPLQQFFGLAMLFDVSGYRGRRIEAELFKAAEDKLKYAQFAVLKTGYDKLWGSAAYFDGYPVLSVEAAEYLASLGLQGVAVDAISIDDEREADSYPIHNILLGAGMIVAENLCCLDDIAGDRFLLSLLPLKYIDADGSPLRAVAFEAPAGIYYPA